MKKILFLAWLLVLLDQVTKFLFQYKEYNLLSFFSIKYAENTGSAFSLFQGYNLIFILVSFLALGLIIYYFRKYPLGLSFIIAGITGNLIDRIFFGYVRDFISVGFWPIFNIADACNVIGVCILIFYMFKEKN